MGESTAESAISPQAHLNPTPPSQRIQVIDALRGLAIFGILMVNMHYFSHPWNAPSLTPEASTLDEVTHWIVNAFFTSKFFSLFSFLFGLGMAIQMFRAEEKGVPFAPVYIRRLIILMVFGLAHAILLWIGDILFIYSIMGFLLLIFWRKARPRTLVIWASILLGVMLLFFGFAAVSLQWAQGSPEAQAMLEENAAAIQSDMEAEVTHDALVYGTGSYWEVTRERAADFANVMLQNNIWIAPNILAMFLLGLAFGKRRLFENLDASRPFFRRLLLFLLPIGLLTNVWWASLGYDMAAAATTDPDFLFGMTALTLGGPALCLSYVSGVVLLSHKDTIARLLTPFAAVGRMALTNYLTHSIVMSTLFYGYGLGLLGSVSMAEGVLMGIGLYALQVPVSSWWMKRFRYGPFEWLWRSLTYGSMQPMRIRQAAAAA